MAKSSKRGRSARTGQFTTVAKAKRYSDTHVVERIRHKPSCGKKKPSYV